ncbi:MAG: hypothetical protein WCW13_04930 [archaeon]|jgi:hypothetical protein
MNKLVYLAVALMISLTVAFAEDANTTQVISDQNEVTNGFISADINNELTPTLYSDQTGANELGNSDDSALISIGPENSKEEYKALVQEVQELAKERRELLTKSLKEKDALIMQQIRETTQNLSEKQLQLNDLQIKLSEQIKTQNMSEEEKKQVNEMIKTRIESIKEMVNSNSESKIENLKILQEKMNNLADIKLIKYDLRQAYITAVQDSNSETKKEAKTVQKAVARIVEEAIKQNTNVNFDEISGLEQEIIMAAKEIIVDSNNTLQARRAIKTMVKDKVLEIRNTQDTLELVDGNDVVQVESPIKIDDSGLSMDGKEIKLLPSKIRAKINQLEKMKLKLENGLAKYEVELQNTRNLFGFIPIGATEKAIIDANSGTVTGYERPFWSIISTGNDSVQGNEQIQ